MSNHPLRPSIAQAGRRILVRAERLEAAKALETRLRGLGYDATAIVAADEAAVATGPRPAGAPIHVEIPADHGVGAVSDSELRAHVDLALCRHDAERAVHELEAFFEISTDLFCFLDYGGYFRRLNPAWQRMLGFTRRELMSRPFIEFVHPDDRERTLNQNAAVREGGRAAYFENRYICKDGSYRWLLWMSAPAATDRVIYAVARDITESKRAEEERARLVRELQATLAEVKTLREILPICSYCRKIRDDENYWQTVDSYVAQHTNTRFSHSICPSCMASEVEPGLRELEDP